MDPPGSTSRIHRYLPQRSTRIQHFNPAGSTNEFYQDPPLGSNGIRHKDPPGCTTWNHLDLTLGSIWFFLDLLGSIRVPTEIHQDPKLGYTMTHYQIHKDFSQVYGGIHQWDPPGSTNGFYHDPQLGSTRIHFMNSPGSTIRIHN